MGAAMSRSKHPRGKSRKYGDHLRKNKEWGADSPWKPGERPHLEPKPGGERRSPRKRLPG